MISARERRLSLRLTRARRRLRVLGRPVAADAGKAPEAVQRPPEDRGGASERQAIRSQLSPARRAQMDALANAQIGWKPSEPEPTRSKPERDPKPKPEGRRGEIIELFRLALAHPFGGHGAPFGYEIEYLVQEFLGLPAERHDEIERWSADEGVALRMLAQRDVQLAKAVKALGRTERDVLKHALTAPYVTMPHEWKMAYGASFDV